MLLNAKQFTEAAELWLVRETVPYILIEGFETRFKTPEEMQFAMKQEAYRVRSYETAANDESWKIVWLAVANDAEAVSMLFEYQKDFYYSWDNLEYNADIPAEWESVIARIYSEILEGFTHV